MKKKYLWLLVPGSLLLIAAAGPLSQWTSIDSIADGDFFALTDVSDTTDSVNGTSKKATGTQLQTYIDTGFISESEMTTHEGAVDPHAVYVLESAAGTAHTRDAEDSLTDGGNLPDGAAVKAYGDTNWGDQDISGSSWNSVTNTLTINIDGGASEDVPLTGFGTASTRDAEDTLTDGSNLPDGAAIIAYGDVEWNHSTDTVYNNTGSTITEGTIVAITGSAGGYALITEADKDTDDDAAGIVIEDIGAASTGEIQSGGIIKETWVNTLGMTAGDPIYLGDDGAYTDTKPTSGNIIKIGLVGTVAASSGSLILDMPAHQQEADEVYYGNSSSGLTADDVQAAIDEVDARVDINDAKESNSSDATLLARANHTGTQTLATISDSGTAASRDTGTDIGDVPLISDDGSSNPVLPFVLLLDTSNFDGEFSDTTAYNTSQKIADYLDDNWPTQWTESTVEAVVDLQDLQGAVIDSQVPNDITINEAGALVSNGANCSAGQVPLGVDASGAAEGCLDVWTEAENTSAGYIGPTGVTYGNLNTNGDVGTGAGQLAIGNHNHSGTYEPADATIIKQANVDDTPDDGDTTTPPSANWAYDHENDAAAHRSEDDVEALIFDADNTGDVETTGYVSGQAKGDTDSSGDMTMIVNGVMYGTDTGDGNIPDGACDGAEDLWNWVVLISDTADAYSLTSDDASNVFVLDDLTSLDAGDELDVDGSQVSVLCVAAETWKVTGYIGAAPTDGGTAD